MDFICTIYNNHSTSCCTFEHISRGPRKRGMDVWEMNRLDTGMKFVDRPWGNMVEGDSMHHREGPSWAVTPPIPSV